MVPRMRVQASTREEEEEAEEAGAAGEGLLLPGGAEVVAVPSLIVGWCLPPPQGGVLQPLASALSTGTATSRDTMRRRRRRIAQRRTVGSFQAAPAAVMMRRTSSWSQGEGGMKETTVNGDFPICFYAAQPLHRVFLPAFRFGAVRQLAGDVSMALALLAHQIRGAFPARIEALVDLSGETAGVWGGGARVHRVTLDPLGFLWSAMNGSLPGGRGGVMHLRSQRYPLFHWCVWLTLLTHASQSLF